MLQQDAGKQRILEVLNLEDTIQALCAFAIEKIKTGGVGVQDGEAVSTIPNRNPATTTSLIQGTNAGG